MKKLFTLLCLAGLVLSLAACTSSGKDDSSEEDSVAIELAGTAWASASGNLAINFTKGDGISVVNMKHVYLLGTYVQDRTSFTATFTTRIDHYDQQEEEWEQSDLSEDPMVITFKFSVRLDKDGIPIATVGGGAFPGHDNDVIMIQVR